MADTNTDVELELSAEDKQAEEEALSNVESDDLKVKLAEELGLDPEADAEKLEKIAQRVASDRKKLSAAVRQKIGYREKLKNGQSQAGKGDAQNKGVLTDEEFNRRFNERMDERELKSLNLSDEIEQEVRDLAKSKGISVREAAQHEYIQFKKEKAEKERRIKAATPKRANKSSYASSIDVSKPLNPADFDFNTKEGVAAWKEAKEARRQHEKGN